MQRVASIAIITIVLGLAHDCAVGSGAHEQVTAAREAPEHVDDWRRTANGWERKSSWPSFDRPAAPRRMVWMLHPVALGLLQLLLSLAALLAFSKPHRGSVVFVVSSK